MPTLKRDIKSILAPKKVFAKEGDTVSIISRHGHVLIAEGPDLNRFPIIDDDLTEQLPDAVEPPPWTAHQVNRQQEQPADPEPAPAEDRPPDVEPEESPKPEPTRKPTRINAPKPIDKQGSLF